MNFRWKVASALGTAVLILIAAGAAAYRIDKEHAEMNRWVVYTLGVLEELGRARLGLAEATSARRGLVLTRNPQLRSAFQAAREDLRSSLERMRTLTADKAEQQRILHELEPLIAKRLEWMEKSFSFLGESPADRAFQEAVTKQGVALNAEIQKRLAAMEANERSLLKVRSAASEEAARRTPQILFLASGLALTFLMSAGWIIYREMGSRARVEAGLRTTHDLLGLRFEEQGVELSETLDSLTEQIRERRNAEEQARRLNLELEARVRQRTLELEEANRELEAFTYSVSHDLRAPLRHIDGFSRILLEDYQAGLVPEAKHHLHRIRDATRHMGCLVDDLLNLSRVGRQRVVCEPVSLRKLADEVIADLKDECGGRDVDWQIGELPTVECDAALVRQVFANLIGNAVKFTASRPRAVIAIGSRTENGEAVIYVRDNGVGFDMKYADKLFGVFQRLHRQEEFEGTGVGLATVHRIIHRHGGRVWAEAQPDQGAAFFFSLSTGSKPRAPTAEALCAEA